MTSMTLSLYQKKGAIIKIISSFLGVMQRPLYLLARLVSAKLNKWFFIGRLWPGGLRVSNGKPDF